MEVREVGDDQEAVGAAGGHPEAFVAHAGEEVPVPLAEGGGVLAEVHDDVEDGTAGDPDEFALGGAVDLVVEAAEDGFFGAAVVVLNEVHVEAEGGEGFAVPGFEEEAAFVAVDAGHEEEGAVDFEGFCAHGVWGVAGSLGGGFF